MTTSSKLKKSIASTFLGLGLVVGFAGVSHAESGVTVKSGDTLSGIAAAHGTTPDHLAAVNGIANPDVITVGQHISVSGAAVQAQAEAIPNAPSTQAPAQQLPYTPEESAPVATQVSSGGSAKEEIAQRESGGNYNAVNSSSGATGKYQCLPSAHGSCPSDPAAQEAWADNYVSERYGSWDAALAHHDSNGWY